MVSFQIHLQFNKNGLFQIQHYCFDSNILSSMPKQLYVLCVAVKVLTNLPVAKLAILKKNGQVRLDNRWQLT